MCPMTLKSWNLKTDTGRIDVMFGPQCAGKTTLANTLLSGHSLISHGEEVRGARAEDSRRREAEDLIAKAEPWPPYLGLAFIKDGIISAVQRGRDILLDGYPRQESELLLLREFLLDNSIPDPSSVIEVTANRKTLLSRYALRDTRGESMDFFGLRYRQYIEVRDIMRSLANQVGANYMVIDTSEP